MTGTVLLSTESGDLYCVDAANQPVSRIGFAPEPWTWTPWEYADGGRFTGRWDDPNGIWRTLYDATDRPTIAPGRVPRSWCRPRQWPARRLVRGAQPYGVLADPGARFLRLARRLGLPDVDAAAIRGAEPRAFTQAVAAWLHDLDGPDGQPVAGIQFASRHGDGRTLWAIFERSPDEPVSSKLHDLTDVPLDVDDPDLVEAMRIHRLDWS